MPKATLPHHFLPESLRVYMCVSLCACSAEDDGEFLLVTVPSRGFPAQGMPCMSTIIHGACLGRTTATVGGGQKDKASVSRFGKGLPGRLQPCF